MRHVLELAILLLPTGHADEQAIFALNDLDVIDHKAMIKDDRDKSLQLLFFDRKDLDLGNLHVASPLDEPASQADRPLLLSPCRLPIPGPESKARGIQVSIR
jgi:hypothetical protein